METNLKLNQVIAIEKGTKTRSHTLVTETYQNLQKPALFSGFSKRYTPRDETNGIKKPDEGNRVQFSARDLLSQAAASMSDLFDVTMTKDVGNCIARANVVVDGVTLVENAPVTYLLFLEKKLTDLHTMVKKIPTLDAGESWLPGTNSDGNTISEAQETQSIENFEEPVVVVPASEKHPAQVQIAKKQRVVGTWRTVKFSSALPAIEVKAMTDRVEKLQRSVKLAREQANMQDVEVARVGQKVFSYIFG